MTSKNCMIAFLLCIPAVTAAETESLDKAGKLLKQLEALDNQEFSSRGLLKRSYMQLDEDNIRYVVQVGDRKYDAQIDDGRQVRKQAEQCDKEEFIGLNPTLGCPISFDAEYNVDILDGGAEVNLIIWNVAFRER